jgi:hypothetical protein
MQTRAQQHLKVLQQLLQHSQRLQGHAWPLGPLPQQQQPARPAPHHWALQDLHHCCTHPHSPYPDRQALCFQHLPSVLLLLLLLLLLLVLTDTQSLHLLLLLLGVLLLCHSY